MSNSIIRTKMGIFVLRDDTLLSRWIENANALDLPNNIAEIASFAHVIPENGVAIDAGACLGDHALTYSQIVGASGEVFAFEPHPVVFSALVHNMARLNNVTCFPYGLSNKSGRTMINTTPNIGAAYLVPESGDKASWPKEVIELVTLDEFLLPRLTRCDFIHLDAEGMEPAILNGATKLIETFRPALVVELRNEWLKRYGSSETALLKLISDLGYDVFPIPGQTYVEQRDVICLRKETCKKVEGA